MRIKKFAAFSFAALAVVIGLSASPEAQADTFVMCGDTLEGVVGGHTSCSFAANVRAAFYASGMASQFVAYSPVTGERYLMLCEGRYPAHFIDGETLITTRCYGGDGAEVVIW